MSCSLLEYQPNGRGGAMVVAMTAAGRVNIPCAEER